MTTVTTKAPRSPSSATAARAARMRSTCATPASTSPSACARAARPKPRPRPTASPSKTPAEAVRGAELVAVLTPDMVQPQLYADVIEPNIKPGACLLFAHGFNVHFGQIAPREDLDVVLVAPKGPGALVRREYEIGRGVPCVYAVHQDASGTAEATRAGLLRRHRRRARTRSRPRSRKRPRPICSASRPCCAAARPSWCRPAWRRWSKPATSRKSPTTKCLHELKLIVDLFYEGGITRMHEFITETAQYGDSPAARAWSTTDTGAHERRC